MIDSEFFLGESEQAKSIKQCTENLAAIISHYGLPPVAVVANQSDRIMARVPSGFREKLELLCVTERFERWDFVRDHGLSAVRGWREFVATYSMQVIEHDTGTWEFDVDVCNPDFGLAPILGHLIECVIRGKTDPFKVCRGLRKRGIFPVQVS